MRSDGHLELAPKFTLVADADASYLWSLRTDPSGVLYAGGGSPAKVFRIDASGKPKAVFESTDLLAQCIAFDSKGTLYVGTSPDGKVYKVSSTGEKSVFFEPKTKYIWDLAFSPDGTLYVATGDKGQIYSVTPEGKGDLYYSSDEAHIKILGFDSKGNLLAGTEPNGRVLRISRTASQPGSKKPSIASTSGFVLYETAKREVTSLAVGSDGNIYVSAIGDKPRATGPGQNAVFSIPQGANLNSGAGIQAAPVATPFIASTQAISSAIYRITSEGVPEEIWSSRDEIVYSLGLNSDGRLLAGTGNNGSLLVIDGRGVYAQLAKAGSAQITGISRAANGKVYLCTANPGKVFSLGPEYEPEGTFESQSFDAKLFSQWGRIEWWGPPETTTSTKNPKVRRPAPPGTLRAGPEIPKILARNGRPGSGLTLPPTRKSRRRPLVSCNGKRSSTTAAQGTVSTGSASPTFPKMSRQSLTASPCRIPAFASKLLLESPSSGNVTLKQPPAPNPNPSGTTISNSNPNPPVKFEPQPQGTQQKTYQSVLWSAHDDNDDDLKYSVYFRGENQHDWLLLKDDLDQKFYSWDTTSMPDGAYYLKIVASDSPSNPPELALSAERESDRFEVDNTTPSVSKIEASPTGMNADRSHGVSYDFQFTASHPTSSIEKAQYSVDGGDWILVGPASGISDYKTESYSFTVRGLSPGEHTIAVRAFDRFENVGSAKTTIQVGK